MFGKKRSARKRAARAVKAGDELAVAGRKVARAGRARAKADVTAAKADASAAKADKKAAKVHRKAAAAQAKALTKASRSGAKAAKARDKAAAKALKATTKATTSAAKADAKAAKAGAKAAKEAAKEPGGVIGTLTNPKTARRVMAVAKIAGPAVAPIALRVATAARGALDERRAIKLGVGVQEVAAYRGPTGPAGARIAGLRSSIDELRQRRVADLQVTRFSDVAKARLADLDNAVHTSASMPPARRRGTLAAIGRELNRIEADLMTHLVGTGR